FGNASAKDSLAALSSTPDGILVSDETVNDFQLNLGDQLNIRLQSNDHQYRVVPFTFRGIVREFPTAPRDSFLVANAAYVAAATTAPAREIVPLKARQDPAALKSAAAAVVNDVPGIRVTEIGETSRLIESGLTAVSVHGLAQIELFVSALMVAAAAGL